MPIENTHTITGRGTVVSGRVERGVLELGATIEVVGRHDGAPRKAVVTGIQSFHKGRPHRRGRAQRGSAPAWRRP